MRRTMSWIGAVLLCAGCAGVAAEPGEPPGRGAAFQAHRDPGTGRFVEPAPELAARAAPARSPAVQTSAAGLVERPTGTPAGGYGVRLGGRFGSYLVGTRGEDGALRLDCLAGVESRSRQAQASTAHPQEPAP